MKKIIIYFICFICICFILPSICTNTAKQVSSNENIIQDNHINTEKNTFKYNEEYSVIKLLHTENNQIEEMKIDDYLYGVVSAEMPANYEIEALKAQAIVARTYLIYQMKNNKGKHENADICDSYACCQAWISKEERLERWDEGIRENNWQKIVSAVDETTGKIITYNNEPINAFFHSNSGGITESSSNIWGQIEYPYLQSVETSGEEGYEQYNSSISLSNDELLNKIKDKYPNVEIDFNSDECIKILEYTSSGRVRTVKFGNIEIAGTEARTILGLKSTNFTINKENGIVTFFVTGYGHGVGMSQTGADSMAKQGSNYEEIIKHFYTGVEITYLN